MTKLILLCLVITTYVALFATCSKMSTELTTEVPKNSKAVENSKTMGDSRAIDTKEGDVLNDTISDDDKLMAAMTICNDSFRIEMSFLVSLNESGSFPDETDKTPKCFLRCVLQTLEIASTDDGKIDPQRAANIFADERGGEDITDIATFCAQRDEKCHCEMAYNFLKCLFSMEIENANKKPKS